MMFYYPVNKSIFSGIEKEKKDDFIDCLDAEYTNEINQTQRNVVSKTISKVNIYF